MESVTVIGAGLAGSECAWQLAQRGIPVVLREKKPEKKTPAHVTGYFAELCCSNSLRGAGLENAVGLLKEELRRLDSLLLRCADATAVPAGGALAVDREGFARMVTESVLGHPNITMVPGEVTAIPEGNVVIASGPLTSDALADAIAEKLGGGHTLNFFDAAAPLVTFDSVDMDSAYFASRYDKGTPDYINCPMTKEEYQAFWAELVKAEEAEVHGFEDSGVIEGSMPVEVMARRGEDTLRFGPLKPRGLVDPKTGREPYAVVQLRRDNADGTIYNLVGFQTHLKWGEQKRVFSMIPALLDAQYLRFGVMRGWRGLARCVALMHGNGDIGGSHITQIVFNRIGDGEVAGLAGCLVADSVSRDEGQTLERLLVVLQVVLEFDRGAIRVGHMVKHIHGHDAAGTHLGNDIAGLGH